MNRTAHSRAPLPSLRDGLTMVAQPLVAALFVVSTAACAAKAPPPPKTTATYTRAEPFPDTPRRKPEIVRVAAAPSLPGQMKPMPKPVTLPGKPSSPEQVVANANRKAAQVPDEKGYFNAVVQYNFEAGTLYQVYAAPMRVTDIVLEPGEHILGEPASGDVVRWELALGKSMDKGVEAWHLYLKPTRPELETNLVVNTDKRTYLLELHSYESTYMAAVHWTYPQDEIAKFEAETAQIDELDKNSAPVLSLDALNFNYAIQVVKGRPVWTPVQVFDDGRRTFVRFPATMLVREAPALFVLRDKETQLVNYRMKGDFYVIDRLIDSAELRVGQQEQEIVRVLRTSR
jgi:P-type conjugative transfer protein TrbG